MLIIPGKSRIRVEPDSMERSSEQSNASMELFVPKPLVYKAKRQTPATEHQKERLRELLEQYGRKDSISWETLTRSEASRLQDKIRAGNF